jgi:hypothetical protein
MSTDIVDLNSIAGKVAAQFAKDAILEMGKLAASEIAKLQSHFQIGAAELVRATYEKVGRVKTLIHPQDSVAIWQIYVPLNYTSRSNQYTDQQVINSFRRGGGVLITGTAGGGKSMFMRQATVELLSDFKDTLPLHYDLRRLNEGDHEALLKRLHKHTSQYISSLDEKTFIKQVQSGKISLILDGFDEIDHNHRDFYTADLVSLLENFPKARVLISSRPDEGLQSLTKLRVFSVEPMTLGQCKQLISKLEYDPESKSSFASRLDEGLFEEQREFLSVPLLSTMMLMTFSEFSEFPSNISIFYKQAFEVVFQRHDRIKGAYTRRLYSQLPITDFERAFSYFCAKTYAQQELSFFEGEIISLLADAIKFQDLSVSPEDFLKDLIESTCLIHRDGLQYTFTHRSFQEYFTAVFISKRAIEEAYGALEAIRKRGESEGVLLMLYGINDEFFERCWAQRTINEIWQTIEHLDADRDPKGYICAMFDKFFFMENSFAYPHSGCTDIGQKFFAIEEIYNLEHEEELKNSSEERGDLTLIIQTRIDLRNSIEKVIGRDGIEKLMNRKAPPGYYPTKDISNELLVLMNVQNWTRRDWRYIRKLNDEINKRVDLKQDALSRMFVGV